MEAKTSISQLWGQIEHFIIKAKMFSTPKNPLTDDLKFDLGGHPEVTGHK